MPNVVDCLVPKPRFRARDCFGGYRSCEIVFVPVNGRQKVCTVCRKGQIRDALAPFRTPERKREYRRNNQEADRLYARRAYQRMAERLTPAQKRDMNLRRRYHLSLAGRIAILEADGWACPVCGDMIADMLAGDIDHDHACCAGKGSCGRCIRGIVHHACNLLLGRVEPLGFTHPYLDTAPERMKRNDEIRQATYGERLAA